MDNENTSIHDFDVRRETSTRFWYGGDDYIFLLICFSYGKMNG
jgi:hypothetical protein